MEVTAFDLADIDLVPARMVNEFCYCPRLAWYELVEGQFAHSSDTLEGRLGHRNVDREDQRETPIPRPKPAPKKRRGTKVVSPDLSSLFGDDEPTDSVKPPPEAPEPEPAEEEAPESIHARSIMLASAVDGVIAKMDLLEIEGMVATPVDYKKGAVPTIPEAAWEPDRVQLCVQALILREAGFTCNVGIIYYIASRQRVQVAISEALIARTRQLIQDLRAMTTGKRIPMPLVDSPKCPRCSLVGICLPDETRLLAETEQAPAAEQKPVRRMLPARDEALPVYVQAQGASIGKKGERIVVHQRDEADREVKMIDISQLCILGNVSVTAPALREIASAEIPILHFSYGGWFTAITTGLPHKNVLLRIAQYEVAADGARSLILARAFITAKAKNQRTLVRRHVGATSERALGQLSDLIVDIEKAASPETLLGLEGSAARLYFDGFSQMIGPDKGFQFDNRNRRPPRDPVNALLSFVYAMLAKDWVVTLTAVGFDPYLGFFHRPRYGRPALALDLAEEFRPIIADSVVLNLINTGEIRPNHFVKHVDSVALTESGRKAVIAAYERRMEESIRHPLFGYRITYRRIFEVQARILARAAGRNPQVLRIYRQITRNSELGIRTERKPRQKNWDRKIIPKNIHLIFLSHMFLSGAEEIQDWNSELGTRNSELGT